MQIPKLESKKFSILCTFKVSEYNVYITDHFQTTFAQENGRGELNPLVEVTVNSKEENS